MNCKRKKITASIYNDELVTIEKLKKRLSDEGLLVVPTTSEIVRLVLHVLNAKTMKTFTAIVERDSHTKLYVGYVPGFPGAHSQAETLDELQENLREVIEMLLEDENLAFDTQFVGTQQIVIQ